MAGAWNAPTDASISCASDVSTATSPRKAPGALAPLWTKTWEASIQSQ
jgi:hypothetical protein